jgi:propionyl-CoA carboxylase beta chain
MSRPDQIALLARKRAEAEQGGGEARIAAQHAKGKLTARERLDLLLDEGSFTELDRFVTHRSHDFGLDQQVVLGDGVVTGFGRINGRLVYVFSQDFTVLGGSLSEAHAAKICKIMDLAVRNGAPVIGLNDSGGARIQEGVDSLGGYAEVFLRNVLASGVVPQISAILGPCAGGAVYSPAMTDFVYMVRGTSYMFVTGPNVVKTVTHEEVTMDQLGGADVHAGDLGRGPLRARLRAGLAQRPSASCSATSRRTTSTPRRAAPAPTPRPPRPGPGRRRPRLVQQALRHARRDPPRGRRRRVLRGAAATTRPTSSWASRTWAGTRGHRRQPAGGAGRRARHQRLGQGGALRALLRRLQHPAGDLRGRAGLPARPGQEHGGIIKHGAKLLYAYCEATVPKLTVITRKAYGGAYDVMSSKHIRGDYNVAWPTAEVAVMGPKGAVEILFKKEIAEAPDPAAAMDHRVAEYTEKFANPYVAASRGYLDDVIDPRETRPRLIGALTALQGKRDKNPPKKHGNIPL